MDLPKTELLQKAQEVLDRYQGHARVFFKFTCEKCKERCIFDEPNILYEIGICSECGHETRVLDGGMMVEIRLEAKKETHE